MKTLLSTLALTLCITLTAQNIPNPYASIGKKAPKMATLTNGEYDEFFLKDSLVQIGTTIMNRYTGDVEFFTETNPEKFEQFKKHNEKIFRFLSVDPLTKKYPELTPYQYASNRPIDGIDLDGLEHVTYTFALMPNGAAPKLSKTTNHEQNGIQGHGIAVRLVDANGKVRNTFIATNESPKPKTVIDDVLDGPDVLGSKMQATQNNYMGTAGFKKAGEDLGDGSTYVKAGGLVVAGAGVVTAQPELVLAGSEIYEFGGAMDNVASGMKTISALNEGNGTKAAVEVIGAVAGEVSGSAIKGVKGVSEVNKLTTKATIDATIDASKEKINSSNDK